jgi:geranylgeranyl pyrophosphate synthase
MQAAYLFDNVADQDKSRSDDLTSAEELALAIGLLSCGQSALYEAAFAAGRHGAGLRSLLRWAGDCAVKCSNGQFLDAHLEKQTMVTTEEALSMTSLKAGSLGRFAAGLGASMATDDSDIVDLSGEFGFNLFTYLQLVDDLRDACEANGLQGDLMQHKKTLPVVFFHNSLTRSNPEVDCCIIPSEESQEAKADTWQGFESSGSRLFGAIAAEAFLNRAKSALAGIKDRVGTVENLERILRSFEITPQEVVNP